MSWTDDRVEQLKAMWAEGKSASQIAKALGGVTRNAVIGKVHRLGLSNRTATAPRPAEAEAEAPPAAAPAAPESAEPPVAAAPPAPEPAAPAAAAPEVEAEEDPADEVADPAPAAAVPPVARLVPVPNGPQPPAVSEVSEEARRNLELVESKARRLTLLQLTERTCKWPIGDPATEDFWFCGLPAAPGKPYCADHVQVAFQPMSARRDRARAR